ncbi:replication-associated protein [Crucivirus-119]|nr:replication-associated protein [Crucivirus-119]
MKQCYTYDMRLSQAKSDGKSSYQKDEVGKLLQSIAKKFVFQLEKGEETGYVHFQIRASLHKKVTKFGLIKLIQDILKCDIKDVPQFIEPSLVDVHNKKNFNYVLKEQTKLDGPWTDATFALEREVYIPRQYKGIIDKLYPYQKVIFDSGDVFDDRIINVIVDFEGNNGKSTIASICELYGKGMDVPPLNDMKEIIQMICDECMASGNRSPSPLLLDMPRAMNKEKLYGFYSALEQIKKGKLYDPRHSYKKFWIDSPQIWVFTNNIPNIEFLSKDRWRFWSINEKKELVIFVDEIE